MTTDDPKIGDANPESRPSPHPFQPGIVYKRGGGSGGGSKVGWVGPKLGGWVLSKISVESIFCEPN